MIKSRYKQLTFEDIKMVSKENLDERQVVIFSLADEEFGVNIVEVKEIIKVEEVTRIPNSPDYVTGILNLRGSIVLVVDLAKKVSLPTKDVDKDTRIIILEIEGTTVGMIVDNVSEVLRLPADKIDNTPAAIKSQVNSDYIEGVGIIGERLIILLDLLKVMDATEVKNLHQKGSKL